MGITVFILLISSIFSEAYSILAYCEITKVCEPELAAKLFLNWENGGLNNPNSLIRP